MPRPQSDVNSSATVAPLAPNIASAQASRFDSRRVRARLLERAARTRRTRLARNNVVNIVVAIGEDGEFTNQRNAAVEPNTDAATNDRNTASSASALVGERLRDSIREA